MSLGSNSILMAGVRHGATLLLTSLLLGGVTGGSARAQEASSDSAARFYQAFRFEHEGVLGTSLDLRVRARDSAIATQAEEVALAEIERQRRILSSYDSESELRQWLLAQQPLEVSLELATVLRRSEHWRTVSGGAFDPAVARFTSLWREAQQRGELPHDDDLASRTRELTGRWSWDTTGRLVKAETTELNFDGISKGFVIDAVAERLMRLDGGLGVSVNIGGDLRVAGELEVPVRIEEPAGANQDANEWRLTLASRAMATSGPAYRGFDIAGRHFSHLIDPRSGRPVSHTVSVSVVASTAMDADALATAMSVLSVEESLELAESLSDVDCMIVLADGQVRTSPRWPGRFARDVPFALARAPLALIQEDDEEVDWNGGFELEVKFEIVQARGGRYRKPYVAVWIEDEDDFPVRTLALWYQNNGGGNRWLPNLKRWHRNDRVRALVEPIDLLETVAQASRRPGEYTLMWNGTDNAGQVVKPGEYTVYIEVSREHGTYQLMRQRMTLGDEPASAELEANAEIGSASIEYRRKQ